MRETIDGIRSLISDLINEISFFQDYAKKDKLKIRMRDDTTDKALKLQKLLDDLLPIKEEENLLDLLKTVSNRIYEEQYASWTNYEDRVIIRDTDRAVDRLIDLLERRNK